MFRRISAALAALLLSSWLAPVSALAAEVFVSPTGAPSNPGTRNAPLDLATALSTAGPVHPGDTVWLLGGTYTGTFTSRVSGSPGAPIVFRQYPGERATLDGAGSPKDVLTVYSDWAVFWGFEITNSHPGRTSSQTGPWPYDLPRGGGIVGWGTNLKFINLVIHDLSSGIGLWKESVNSEIYGTIFYHNGWHAPDGSHGHGIYTQNNSGVRLVRENIAFNQFSHGIHAYGSSSASLNNIVLEGNVAFNNGVLGTSGFERDLLLGGGTVAQNPVVRQNFTYGGGQSNLGYAAGCANGQVTNNYLMGAAPLILAKCTPAMTGNVLYSLQAAQWGWNGLNVAFPNNTYLAQRPAANVLVVRPNQFEPGRAHVIVYNWAGLASVTADLAASGLQPGDQFEIRDAQNFYGAPVRQGTYTGAPVSIPMSGLTLQPPVGTVPVAPKHTPPEFAVFVVVRGTSAAPGTVATPVIAPAGGTFAGPVVVSLTSATPGAVIRATTNGTAPTSSSPVYAGPFSLAASATVRARAFAPGMADSATAAASFTIGAPDSPPTVGWIQPASGAVLSGTATLSASAADDRGIARVEFSIGGAVAAVATSTPYAVLLDTRSLANGVHQLVATAVDSAGQRTATPARSVQVANGGAAPPGGATTIRLEAEAATLVAPMSVGSSPAASGGRYLGNTTSNSGSATLSFSVPAPGSYRVWLRQMSHAGDTLWLSIDNGAEQLHAVPSQQWKYAWQWLPVTASGSTAVRQFNLAAGAHTLRVRTARSTTRLDAVVITADSGVVSDQLQSPQGLFAESMEGQRVTLLWTPPIGGKPEDYVLEGGTSPGEALTSLPVGSASRLTLDVPTGAYFVRLRAVSGGWPSPPSNEIRIFSNVPQAPSAPVNLLGLSDGSSVALVWRNTFDGGAPTGLILDVQGAVSTSIPLGPVDRLAVQGVPPGIYTVALRAVNAAGVSQPSNPVTLSVPAACAGAPEPITNLVAHAAGRMVSVSWNPPDLGAAPTGYILQVSGAAVASVPTVARSLRFEAPDGTYQFAVVATNPCGNAAATDPESVTVY